MRKTAKIVNNKYKTTFFLEFSSLLFLATQQNKQMNTDELHLFSVPLLD